MNDNLLVTVGIACFNGEDFLREALESVLNSSYKNLEVLIVDDGSTDQSLQIANGVKDPRVKVLSNETNVGLVKTRQKIMEEATGDYLVWLDQDDIALKHRISRQVSFLEQNPEFGVVGSWTLHRFFQDSRVSHRRKVKHLPIQPEEIRASLPFICPISFNTATMRLSSFREAGIEFRAEYGNALDYELWSRAADVMSVGNLPEILGEYSVHKGQTSQGPASKDMLAAACRIQGELLARNLGIKLDPNLMSHIHFRLTLDPKSLQTLDDLQQIGTWLEYLRVVNHSKKAYVQDAFQKQLALQWWRGLWHVGKHQAMWDLLVATVRYRKEVKLRSGPLIDALVALIKANTFLSYA